MYIIFIISLLFSSFVYSESIRFEKDEDSLNTPNYKPKNNDFTVIDEAPQVPPDPFENVRMNEGISPEDVARLNKIANEPSPFNRDPMPIIDYKPKKTGELLYETISYSEEIDVYLPERVGDYIPVKLNFEPNANNFKTIENFFILSPKGNIIEFNKLVKFKEKYNSVTIVFEYNNDSRKNIYMTYVREDYNNDGGLAFIVEHSEFGSFTGSIDGITKKGYVYNMPPYSPDMNYMLNDGLVPE